jgi:hypothetical protein
MNLDALIAKKTHHIRIITDIVELTGKTTEKHEQWLEPFFIGIASATIIFCILLFVWR